MGLRCTVFGHTWGDADTEREREEDGNEVVATVREVRTCQRCGTEEVLGTSTEVTSAAEAAEADAASDAREEAATPGAAGPEADREPYDPETDDGVILDDDAGRDERKPREWPNTPERDEDGVGAGEPSPWPETARETDEEPREERFVGADRTSESHGDAETVDRTPEDHGDAETGDQPASGNEESHADHREEPPSSSGGGEIIEAGGDDGDGDADEDDASETQQTRLGSVDVPGAESAEETTEGPADVAADDGDDSDGTAGSDEASVAHGEPGETVDDESMMGPDATQRPDDDAEVVEATEPNEQTRETAREPVDPTDHGPTSEPDAGSSASSPSLDPSEPPADAEPAPEDVEFYCPECDYVDDSRWPSRRAGDVCPDCRRSYLSERRT